MSRGQKLAQDLLLKVDDAGMGISRADWRELLETIASGIESRIDCMNEEDAPED